MFDSPLGSSPLNPYSGLAKVYETILKAVSFLLPVGPGWSKRNFGAARQYYCESCGGLEPFRYQVRYTYIHILRIFSFVVHRRYVMACGRCAATVDIEADDIAELLHKDPVPYIRRRGWRLCIGVAVLAVTVWHANNFYERTVSGYRIDSPEVGDLYLVDFDRIFGSESDRVPDPVYGYMRVIKVEADTLTFAPSYSAGSPSASPVRRAMRENPAQFEFADEDASFIKRSRLRERLDNEAIVEVTRQP